MSLDGPVQLEFRFDNEEDLRGSYSVNVDVKFTERHTGLERKATKTVYIEKEHYTIKVDRDSILFKYQKPYRLTAHVSHWNGSAPSAMDRKEPVIMEHGRRKYEAFLDEEGNALFEFEHELEADHKFSFKDSHYKFYQIYVDPKRLQNETESFCLIRLRGDRPRLGETLEIEVSSSEDIPYLNYIVLGHSNIVRHGHVELPPNTRSHVIAITPTIEMVPRSFIYVYFVSNGQYRYDEYEFQFPWQFENKVEIKAPSKVRPGGNVSLELKAQPRSLVGLMAVDLGVFLLDPSYDLDGRKVLGELAEDRTHAPILATVYPGLVSGALTLTNAHYLFVPAIPGPLYKPVLNRMWNFRKKFPETWIFDNYEITHEVTKLEMTIPDSITTWRLTAFSVNEFTGFGIVDGPTDIVAIQTFFILVNLPYAVKKGEVVTIPVIVYNYYNEEVEANVTMFNQDGAYTFLDAMLSDESTDFKHSLEKPIDHRTRHAMVPANGSAKVEFLISATTLGDIEIRMTAECPFSQDAVIEKLKVEPEGLEKQLNRVEYARVESEGTYTTTLEAEIPTDSVEGSEYITFSVGGESLVPTLKNLNKLVKLPTKCGEQNMVNFAPSILILNYLKATGHFGKEPQLVDKVKKVCEIGYQQQLAYRHKNGGYSVFGVTDEEASTWLTAYVTRFLMLVSTYLPVEPSIVEKGLEFVAQKQMPQGDIPFTGYLLFPAQQNKFCFTSFALLTFMENESYAKKYKMTIEKGLRFLSDNLHRVRDIYALSVMANALLKAKHPTAQKVLDKLMLERRQMGELSWWSQDDENGEKDVEITAYALLALLQTDSDPAVDTSIFKWLLKQRNARGGFKCTHDTVVGLQALVAFSRKYGNIKETNMKIQYIAFDKEKKQLESGSLKLDGTNALILQTVKLPPNTRSISTRVTGKGITLMQLSSQFNVPPADEQKHFFIEAHSEQLNEVDMELNVCVSYQDPMGVAVNLVIVEANLPSGYILPDGGNKPLLGDDGVLRAEETNGDTTLIIYLSKMEADDTKCLNVVASKTNDVLLRKPAAIVVYDYYNISRHDTFFYVV